MKAAGESPLFGVFTYHFLGIDSGVRIWLKKRPPGLTPGPFARSAGY